MKRYLLTAIVAVVLAGCSGSLEQDALSLVVPASMGGKAAQGLTGTGERLIEQGRIDLHRRVTVHDRIEIDVWVIRARAPDRKGGGKGPPPARPKARGTVVLLHPLLMSKSWFLGLGEMLAKRGWDVVLPDLRAHGRSGGKYVTWGYKEKHDVKAVMDDLTLLENVVSENIYVCGASLGGCVAIQYALLDSRCKGVLALASPAGARQIARRMLMMLTDESFEDALLRAGQIAHFDPDRASAVTAAAGLDCPIMLVHGWLDLVVPFSHSREIYNAAAQPKKLVGLALAGHTPDIGRDKWVADQIDVLVEMGKAKPQARP